MAVLLAFPARAEEKGYIPPAGTLWMAAGWEAWHARERFAGPFGADLNYRGLDGQGPQLETGAPVPLKLDDPTAAYRTLAAVVKVRVVPLPRFMLRAALPVYQVSTFSQSGSRVTTRGSGDLFAFLGYQLTPYDGPVWTSLYLHAKFPTTRAQLGDLSVPLSEGQVDIGPEHATTWAILPQLWLTGRLQYRHRFEVVSRVGGTRVRIKPGDEFEAGLEVGGAPADWLWLQARYRGLWAAASEDRTLPSDHRALEKRQIHWLAADVYLKFGAWLSPALDQLALDGKLQYPLCGVDFLRGVTYSLALAYQLNFWSQDAL